MGLGLIVAGALTLLVALFFDTTGDSEIYNLGLLQYQIMIWTGGLALLIAGSIISFMAGRSKHSNFVSDYTKDEKTGIVRRSLFEEYEDEGVSIEDIQKNNKTLTIIIIAIIIALALAVAWPLVKASLV